MKQILEITGSRPPQQRDGEPKVTADETTTADPANAAEARIVAVLEQCGDDIAEDLEADATLWRQAGLKCWDRKFPFLVLLRIYLHLGPRAYLRGFSFGLPSTSTIAAHTDCPNLKLPLRAADYCSERDSGHSDLPTGPGPWRAMRCVPPLRWGFPFVGLGSRWRAYTSDQNESTATAQALGVL
jgi:hypothetical protein